MFWERLITLIIRIVHLMVGVHLFVCLSRALYILRLSILDHILQVIFSYFVVSSFNFVNSAVFLPNIDLLNLYVIKYIDLSFYVLCF